MAQEDIRQGVSQILEMLSNMSDNPHSARNVAAAAGGRYVGSALNTPSMGFMTFGGNMGHSPMQVGPQDFANQLLGMAVAPSLNRIFSPYSNLNSDVMYAQNHAQVQQAGMMNSLAKVMSGRLEASLGLEAGGGMPMARMMTSQFFSGPLTEERLQMMSRFGMGNNEELRDGMMKSGISTIGLRQFGLIGSLTHQDQMKKLRETIDAAAGSSARIGEVDVLGTAMTLGDPRMNLALSLESKGFGGPEKLAKTTESLKRAKELTGMGSRQTLGLLAEVYDNVIEGVLPDLDKFVDRMMRLERQGVSVTEFSSTVQSMRGRLGRAGVRDSEVAVSAVERALGGRESTREMQWRAGNTGFNQRQYEGSQILLEEKIALSTEARGLAVFAEMGGITVDGPDAAARFEKALKGGISADLPGDLQDALKRYAAGELNPLTIVKRGYAGDYGQEVVAALRAGAGSGYGNLIQNSPTVRGLMRAEHMDKGLMTSKLSEKIRGLYSEGNDQMLFENVAAVTAIVELADTRFQDTEVTDGMSDAERELALARRVARDKHIKKNKLSFKNGTWTATTDSNRKVSLNESEVNGTTLMQVTYANLKRDIGRSQYSLDLENATGMYGLGRTAETREGDLKLAAEHLKKLVTGNPDNPKTSADTLLGIALQAATGVHGDDDDFNTMIGMVREDYSPADWKAVGDKLRDRVMENDSLKGLAGIKGLTDTSTMMATGKAVVKAWDTTQEKLDARVGGEDSAYKYAGKEREKLLGIKHALAEAMSSTKFAGGEVSKEFEAMQATAVAADTTAKNTTRLREIAEASDDGKKYLELEGLKQAEADVAAKDAERAEYAAANWQVI